MRKDSLLANYYYNKLPKAKVGLIVGDPNKPYHPLTNPDGYKGDPPNKKVQIGPTIASAIEMNKNIALNAVREFANQQRPNATYNYITPTQGQQATVGRSSSDEPWRKRQAAEIRRQEAMKNTQLAQTFAGLTPSGDINAGVIGANTFVNMTPGIGIIPASSRLATLINSAGINNPRKGENAYYSKSNSFGENALGALNLVGDIAMLGTGSPLKSSGINVSEAMPGVSLKGFNSADLKKLAVILKRDLNMSQTPVVNVAGKKVYTLQMPSGSSQVNSPLAVIPQMNFTKTPVAIPRGPNNPNTGGLQVSNIRHTGLNLLRDNNWFDYAVKSNDIQGMNPTDIIRGRELGKEIGNGGGFNQGVFDLSRFPGYVLKFEEPAAVASSMQFPEYINFDFVKAMENINNPNIAKVVHQMDLPAGQRALIMPKIQGTSTRKMTPTQISGIPDEAIADLYKNLKTLRNNKLGFDFIGDNMVYDDARQQFQLFDINPAFTPKHKPIGLWDWNNSVLGGGNLDMFGVEQSGLNLKDALTRRLQQDVPIGAKINGITDMNIINQGTKELSDRLARILSGIDHYKRGGMFIDYFKKYGGLTEYQTKGEVTEDDVVENSKKAMLDFYNARPENINNPNVPEYIDDLKFKERNAWYMNNLQGGAMGYYNPITNVVGYNPDYPVTDVYGDLQSTLEHEIGHKVYNHLNRDMRKIVKESVLPASEIKANMLIDDTRKGRKYARYLGKKTEFYTRRNNVFDTFELDPSQPLTREQAQSFVDLTNQINSTYTPGRDVKEARKEFSEKYPNSLPLLDKLNKSKNRGETIEFMNSIKNNPETYLRMFNDVTAIPGQQSPIARYGGRILPMAQYGCNGKSCTQTGEGVTKVNGISDKDNGAVGNYVPLSNAPINYEELVKYIDDQYTDKSSIKQRKTDYAQAAQLFPGLTKEDFYAAQAEAFRINQRINDTAIWDKPENQTYDRAWYPYYRSIIQPGIRVNPTQILKFISAQPGGVGAYRQLVESNYGLKKNKYGGGLLSRTVTCSNCSHSWRAVDGGADVATCHKCGGGIKMKNGGQNMFAYGGPLVDYYKGKMNGPNMF